MDRNREARKSTMAASANGLSRRRHRTNSLRDSPEEDGGPMELTEATARLRDRGVKKDRDRERLSRNRKRRGGGDRLSGVGEESSEESVNDEEEDDYDDERVGGGGGMRMYPPTVPSSNQPAAAAALGNNNHNQYVNRKSFPPAVVTANVARPGWKPADQVIGFTVPRKARSASGKRPQECSISGSGVGTEQINRQTSTSPVRLTPSPSPVSPPSSSNASVRKKMPNNNNNNGLKPRPPKSASKPASSNPEELEIEIAEVLYGMMTQSHNNSSSKKDVVGSDSVSLDAREMNNNSNKSRVSSPISNSTSQLPQNSSSSAAPLSAVAPKRKRPRQVSDNLGSSFSVRHGPISSMTKVEVDLPPKKEISSPTVGSAAENGGVPLDFANSQVGPPPSELPDSSRDVGLAKEEAAVTSPKKESPAVRPDSDREIATVTEAEPTISTFESKREEKFEIDLMAPPPQMRSSPEREGEINFGSVLEQKPLTRNKEGENAVKSGREEAVNAEPEQKRAKVTVEEGESERKPVLVNKERKINLQLNLEKHERDVKLNPDVHKPQQQQQPKPVKDELPHSEKIAQSGSVPLPMSVASWPGGLPPMGTYMAPLRGVVSMDGNTVSPAPIQPLFSHPRPKRCATHCYIARNIHYLQQFMKMNPFWPPAAGSAASLFGAKPCNLNLMPSAELQGNNAGKILNSVQEKGQGLSIFPSQSAKDKGSQANNIADAQRKQQQIMLQQALPPGAPSNILHGPAFIFPLNQQQAAAAAAAASVRPGSVKPPTSSGNVAASTASTSASVSGSTTAPPAATAVTFSYPNMPASETQFLAILQNNPYPFPIPSVGAPPTYRGTQAQAMPFFNGSFYSSQMMHPAQLQQQQQQQQLSAQQQNTSSGSSSSQKHLHSQQQQQQQQQQQRPQGSSGNNLHNFPAPKKTNQHMTNAEVGGEDSPSTADSRVSRASKGVYSQNFAAMSMPIHTQNFALMSPAPLSVLGGAASGGGNQGEKKQQQQQQQQGLKAGVESITPQTFAMSFGSMSGVDMSSVAQNHAMLQSLPDSTRHSIQMMAVAQAANQKKNFRVSEEAKTASAIGDTSTNPDEEKKNSTVKPPSTVGQQSIVFSRTDVPDSISSASLRATRTSSTPNAMATANAPPNSPLQAQLQFQQHQQVMHQLQKQHQQQQQQLVAAAAAVRNKTPSTSNGSVYSDHLASSAKIPNGLSNFQQNLVQNSSSSSSQSHQWKNSLKTASQVPSTTSSLKNPPPQQQNRTQHNQTQISFGGTQKQATPPPPQGQQAANSHHAPSPPMAVGSPTTSSISKGASASPRTTTTPASAASRSAQPSALSSQPPKNSASVGSRNVSSVLSNSHVTNSHVTSFSNTSAKPQMQQQQQQMLISHFMQTQAANQQPFYLQRRIFEQSKPVSSATSSSTGMLSLCSPTTGSNASTSDAKAVAASATSAVASNLKGGASPSQGILHSAVPPGFAYVHAVPSTGQVKPAEQKQPAGNRDSLTRK
ncbi:protein TIME FOR COFFEE isoform X2 [Rhododendron vialii]|uniref:protein TIME FOR COFFEE isoform X2 n=1 Tax=Rhododendron vialii TaxID=182163 RepID=UPI00265EDC69|nr:protein TIME FOR COFFEE isoform X2 [Rhododendron vialii]